MREAMLLNVRHKILGFLSTRHVSITARMNRHGKNICILPVDEPNGSHGLSCV